MSTRCCIELYDEFDKGNPGAMLYHHSDGYPDFMKGKLERFLNETMLYLKEAGYPYWWDAERVAAIMIVLSIEDYKEPLKPFSTNRANKYDLKEGGSYRPNGGIPVFQPCMKQHGDIEYLYKVYLYCNNEEYSYKIECESV